MKKILALVLALALVLGTFSFAAAAPSDVVGTDYEEAVGKLTYLGIISGYPDGTFRPDQPVTRAEFAKIIVTALGVGEAAQYAAGVTKFADVPADHWAAGYINVAVDLGIINGYPDGTFAPENQVTFAEAIKMIVAALGYTPKAENMGGYPGGYLAIAADEEITDDITVVGSLTANRGNVALMINNALEVDMMVQKTWGQYPEYGPEEGENLLKKLGVKEVEGRVVDIPRVNSKLDDNEIRIDGKDGGTFEVIDGVEFELAFGNQVTAYVDDDEVIGLTVDSDFFLDALKDVDEDELTLVEEDEDYDVSEDVIVYIDGDEEDVEDLGTAYDYAKVVLDDDDEVIFIDAYNWDGFLVVEEVDDEVIFGYDEELDTEDYTIVKDGKTLDVEDIEEGDILYYYDGAEFAEVYNAYYEGEVERVFVDSFRIDREEIDIVNDSKYIDGDELEDFTDEIADDMMDEGGVVTVFVDRFGDAVLVIGDTGDADTSTFYAYVVFTDGTPDQDRRGNDYFPLDVISETGAELSYDIDYDVDGSWIDRDSDDDPIEFGQSGHGYNISEDHVVEIEVDEDGEVETVDVLGITTTELSGVDSDGVFFETDDNYVDGYKLQNSAVVFDNVEFSETGDEDDIEVSTLGELGFDEVLEADVYTDSKDRVIAIVVWDSDRSTDTTEYRAVATEDAKRVTGEDTWRLVLNIDGDEDTYYTEEDEDTNNADDVEAGDFLIVEIDDNTEEVIKVTPVTDGRRVAGAQVEDVNVSDATLEDVNGYVYRVGDAVLLDVDYDNINLRAIQEGDLVDLFLISETSSYAAFVVIVDEVDEEEEQDGDIEFAYTDPELTVSGLVYSTKGNNDYIVRIYGDAISDAVYSDDMELIKADDGELVFNLTGLIPANGIYTVELINLADVNKVIAAKSIYMAKNNGGI